MQFLRFAHGPSEPARTTFLQSRIRRPFPLDAVSRTLLVCAKGTRTPEIAQP